MFPARLFGIANKAPSDKRWPTQLSYFKVSTVLSSEGKDDEVTSDMREKIVTSSVICVIVMGVLSFCFWNDLDRLRNLVLIWGFIPVGNGPGGLA